MVRRPSILLFLVVWGGLGCAPVDPSPDPVAAEAQPIIGGQPDPGADLGLALIIIRDARGRHYASCSGSMLTRRVLMTAAHCADADGYTYEAWFADAYNAETKVFTGLVDSTKRVAVAKWVHPKWTGEDNVDKGYDIALLALDQDIPAAVKPLPWNRERVIISRLGESLRIAGFGDRVHDSTSPDYIKMTATNTVSAINAFELQITGPSMVIASGDSGGPAWLLNDGKEVVAGISSYGLTSTGNPEISAFSRVDLYLDEIDAFIAANDPQAATSCGADGICGYACTAVDPDCPCVGDGLCTTACTTPDRDPDCPLHCGADDICVREGCAAKDPDCGEKPVGMECASSNECLSDLCVPDGSHKLCAVHCGTGGSCDDGYACHSTGNICLPSSSSGCGCRASGQDGSGGWIALVVAGALLWVRRRTGPRRG